MAVWAEWVAETAEEATQAAAERPCKGMKISVGRVFGKVVDSLTKKPVEFASVALYTLRTDSLITGQLT